MRRLEPHELGDAAVWRTQLGRKASMRLRLTGDPQHPFTEAIGVVQAVRTSGDGAPVLVLVDRRGSEREVPLADVLAAKVF